MTLKRYVNPKKLRPYDQPPRRRRSLIPSGPDSAATGFLVVAAMWLPVAGGLGMLAIGLRVVSIELSLPLGVFDWSIEFNAARVNNGFVVAAVYGWLTNAGIAAALFITPRLAAERHGRDQLANIGLGIFNLAVAVGLLWLYFGELPAVAALAALPAVAEIGMLIGLLLVTTAYLGSIGREAPLRERYVSTWFFVVAFFALLGLTAANAALSVVSPPASAAALASAFLERAIEAYWLFGATAAVLYYVVPRATGNPLYSRGLAALGWATWVVLASLSGLGMLADPSVPYWLTTVGKVATMLLVVPAFLLVANLVLTVSGRWTLIFGAGAFPFAIVSLAFLLGSGVLGAVGALRTVAMLVGGTDWLTGSFIYAALGAYTLAMLAFAEHASPRLLRREWGGGVLYRSQLWTAFGGATVAGLALMAAGLAQGSLIVDGIDPETIAATLLPYRAVAALSLGLVAVAGAALLGNLFLMYTGGRVADYPVASAAKAAAAH